ncbi:tumor necrosis factor receptor superfamily member 6 [Dama dama]|uniref:tumor necrosis factor receptor superfamily member 6 n=1 Tax=Dama dama TaxID=30532 RepID=UPI002A36A888|nr:tumor necrosis factor receptor superfamily member 6 [Dama dama]
MSGNGVLLSLIFISVAGPLSKGEKAHVAGIDSEVLKLAKNITEVSSCPEGLHREHQFCCLPCPPGKRKTSDCKHDRGIPECVFCSEGNEYTDTSHHSHKCIRCSACDEEHGLEVEQNCTRTQNTKCRCKSNFFCNSSPCEHCNPCTTCEHGIIEKCSPTSNTKCKGSRSHSNSLWALLILLIPIVLIIYKVVKSRHRNKKNDYHNSEASNDEGRQLNLTDVDLGKYIPTIAELMKITQVKEFVRKNGIEEAKIDDIMHDNLHETAEQKVQLLRSWYQSHGKKNAYCTLTKNLPKTLAEKICDIVTKDITNERENANLQNENENLV